MTVVYLINWMSLVWLKHQFHVT